MAAFQIEFTDERILPTAGLSLVGAILGNSGFTGRINSLDITGKRKGHHIKNGDLLTIFIALCAQGKPQFEAVNEMKDDPDFYKLALGVSKIPSEEILRQRMDEIGRSKRKMLLKENVRLLKANGIVPTALPNGAIPLDIDVTPCDNSKTKKQGVSRTYKGFDGFAPMMAYLGREGYLINCELREGKQHCQKHTVEFLLETIELVRMLTDKPILIRLDSGNDASDNIGIFMEENYKNNNLQFIIKRNPRQEDKEEWLTFAKENSKNVSSPRDGKTVYIGETFKDVTYSVSESEKKTVGIRTIYEITERTIDKHGQFLFPHDIELGTYWTSTGFSDEEVINLYHAHGESEQFHSEFKTDMDMERFPSGKFDTNELVMELGMMAYNILRMIGQESLGYKDAPIKHDAKRRRLRTVITNIIQMAAHITTHARKNIMGLGRSNTWRHTFARIMSSFVDFEPLPLY